MRRKWLTEGNIELRKTVLGVSLRDGVEHDRVVQDVVVEGEVTATCANSLVLIRAANVITVTHAGIESTPLALMLSHRFCLVSLATAWRSSAEVLNAQ
jgi:hypothetical protein